MKAHPAATAATAAAASFPPEGAARQTATPTPAPTAPAASPASAAWPAPSTAARPQIRRVTSTSGIATAVWPTVFPTASAAATRCGGTSCTRTTSTTIVSAQQPARPAAATFSRPMTNITRVRFAITAKPATPGANRTNDCTSSGT